MRKRTQRMARRLGLLWLFDALFRRQDTTIFSVLRVRDYRNLWTGQLISFLGDSLAYSTLIFAIIRMADEADVSSGKRLSLLFVLSALPSLFLGMVAGTVVDRANRKHIMIGADILRGFLALGFLLVTNIDQMWIFIVVSVLLSSVSTFFFPARTALLPVILEKEMLLSANALAQLTVTLAAVVGAAVAGVMVGATGATAPAFVFDSLTFFVSAFFIMRIATTGRVERAGQASTVVTRYKAPQWLQQARSALQTLRAMAGELWVGLRYVLTDQVMRGVLISFLALMTGLGAANVTFVPLLIDELGMPEEGLGPIRASQTLGIILSSAIITAIAARYKARDLIGLSMVIFGITTLAVSITTNYALMLIVLFLVGLTISPPQIVASTLIQRHVPSEKLGRASGAQGTIINVANIASMGAAGLLMDEIGAREVFALAGAMIFCAGFVSWWVLRGVEEPSKTGAAPVDSLSTDSAAPVADPLDIVPQA